MNNIVMLLVLISIALSLGLSINAYNKTMLFWPLNYDGKPLVYSNSNGINTYTWESYPGATSYIAEAFSSNNAGLLKRLGDSTFTTNKIVLPANIYSVQSNTQESYVRVTAVVSHGNVSIQLAPCFLKGSIVTMHDGTEKCIEDVLVGDFVRGAFGEKNQVLALHRPLLGDFQMCRVNNEHTTTNHHPHVGANRNFYCGDPETVTRFTYNRSHEVIGANGLEEMFLHGLHANRLQKLELGTLLQTIKGAKTVETLETFSMPSETQLYNLVVNNSHTYFVEGYAVTGWPREDDFDYDIWQPKA